MTALVCPHQPSCPGCPRLAEPGLPREPLDRLRRLAEREGIAAPEEQVGPPTQFRRRARLAIRGRADAPKLGIFEAGSHRAAHIPSCLVHHPVVNVVARAVRQALAAHHVPTYSDAAHAGVARYLQVVVERHTERAQIVLITNASSPSGLEPVFEALAGSLGDALLGLWWNGNAERTNAILGPHWQLVSGEPFVRDRSGDAALFYPPSAFGQSNLDLAMELAERARALAQPGDRVTELYAGVGAIGLGLAARVTSLDLNELGEGSLAGLARGIEALPAAERAKVRVYPGSAADHAGLVASRDLVIADPPRKGLDAAVVSALLSTPPRRFAYVSCDLDSFERDAAQLLRSLRLSSLSAYDLFPHTEHIETLAVFEAR